MSTAPNAPESTTEAGTAGEAAAPAGRGWGRWVDGALLVGVGLFLAYRFVGTGAGTPPQVAGVAVMPPGDRPSFVELSSTR